MNKDETAYLRLMLDSFGKIREFTAGMDEGGFLTDRKTQSAVIMQLEVVGELAKKVSESIQGKTFQFHGNRWLVCVI